MCIVCTYIDVPIRYTTYYTFLYMTCYEVCAHYMQYVTYMYTIRLCII